MEFIVKLQDGTHKGPIDQETLRKWVESGTIQPETPVRNAVLSLWKEAKDFEFLDEAFIERATREALELEQRKSPLRKILDRVLADFHKPKAEKEQSSAFKYEYIPRPASSSLRIGAAIIDWSMLALLAIVLLGFGMSSTYIKALTTTTTMDKPAASADAKAAEPAEGEKAIPALREITSKGIPSNLDDATKGIERGSVWTDSDNGIKYTCINPEKGEALWCESAYIDSLFHKLFAVFVFVAFAYFGFSLGFLSQTLGMWYFGIFIVKKDGSPAFPLRTFIFALLSIPLGFLTIVVSFIMPENRSLHDILTGTKLIGIAAKPKT